MIYFYFVYIRFLWQLCWLHVVLFLGFSVYNYAKLRMLQFYYDFLAKYLDNDKFELLLMDTDSYFLSLAEVQLDSCVQPHLMNEFLTEKKSYIATDDYTFRTPGLFKVYNTFK